MLKFYGESRLIKNKITDLQSSSKNSDNMGFHLYVLMLLLIVSLFIILCDGSSNNSSAQTNEEARIYFLRRCNGAGCPYAAAWMAHINLYRRVKWWTESTKMEAASFNM
jgi:hypothetical protein